MPLPDTVESFVQLVEDGRTIDAMVRYYADHATMQENAGAPRVGKAVLIQHEEAALASIVRLQARCIRPILVAGDCVVIRWVFEIEEPSGRLVRFEELAHQRWEGELIVEERFFYDPAQLASAGAPHGHEHPSDGPPRSHASPDPSPSFFRDLEHRRSQSLVDRDLDAIHELHAPDYQLITPSGGTFTLERYASAIKDAPFYAAWEMGDAEVRLATGMAVIRYRATLTFPSGRVVQVWHTDVYEHRAAGWQAVWSQATECKPPAAAAPPSVASRP